MNPSPSGGPLLKVENLRVEFGSFPVLQDVTFDLREGETLGLVGESGSGKSTLARAVLRLIPVTSGSVSFCGEDLLAYRNAELRRRRRDLQMVFQDALASLNPRMSVGEALAEPLKIHEPSMSSHARAARIAQMLERVGLSADMGRRYPHEFSGGQCQRIGIARAMMLRPRLLVCDEPVSSLDVSIQGQIVNLLTDLQREFGTAMLFISHNLAVVRHLSHRVLVIYRGRLVEVADRDALFAAPAHPYTRTLLGRVPMRADDVPPTARAGGCPFHDRCAYAQVSCLLTVPPLQEVAPRHFAACHRWREVVYS
ncbi:MAG: oligopeptide/dipeptide transporter ATP-binding protein-like protein [Gammaproteobacteria bacterium]|nr:oligopeptide/dipeptide transporter ATP-binding protein-like protein [Gammaproteobacteria bacterium]